MEAPRQRLALHCRRRAPPLTISLLLCLAACASGHAPVPLANIVPTPKALAPAAPPPPPAPVPELVNAGPQMFGTASWYEPGPGLHRTCTGETLTRNEMSAASHSIPIGTQVRVALVNHSNFVVVRVNDCMPRGHRILDLSEAAAEQLGLVNMGIARVTVTPVMLVDSH
jgi:rare lipoprotein A